MSIDIQGLVEIDLQPIFELDTTLSTAIPDRINAELALQGWTLADITDQRAVYIATLTTKAFIPRLLLKLSMEIKKVKGGKAETEFQEAIKYLSELREELTERLQRAASGAAPEDLPFIGTPWPGVGVVEWQGSEE
jgi:hypothetical protein